jgi:ATP-dependent DNA helicase RecG
MVITPSQIDLWRQAPSEYQNLEFKEAKNQFDREKLSAYCVAIANEVVVIWCLGSPTVRLGP